MTSLIQGLLSTRSVNLAGIASENDIEDGSDSKASSKYRKFQRFFTNFDMPLEDISRLIQNKIPRPEAGYILSMDRTNWQFGQKHINILTVGINVGKVCVPLVWMVLPQSTKKGNSNSSHRQELMEKLLKVIPACDIDALLMDREFNGSQWLRWLDDQGVGFVLRIKRNVIIGKKLAHEHSSSKGRRPSTHQDIWNMSMFFGCKKIAKGRDPYLYVVSNKYPPKEALELYRKRWAIEQLFSHLKKRGFHLEDTHMTDSVKMERLMAMVSISFLFSYGWGLHLRTLEKQTSFNKRQSHYRYGLGSLLRMFWAPKKHPYLIDEFFKWIENGKLEVN